MARLPEVCNFAGALKITMDITGESVPPPEDIADHDDDAGEDDEMSEGVSMEPVPLAKISPPKDNEYLWHWKVCRLVPCAESSELETTGWNLILRFWIYIPLAATHGSD